MTPSRRGRRIVVALGVIGCLGCAEPSRSAAPASVKPGEDFYAYANADWLRSTTLPAGQAAYGVSAMLTALNQRRVQEIVQAVAVASPSRAPLEQKIGDYYASLIDIRTLDDRGLAALASDLERIRAIDGKRALSSYLGAAVRLGDGAGAPTDNVLGLWAHQGFSRPDRYLPHLQQGGLGLASREDYLGAGTDKAMPRARYQAHIAAMLGLLGLRDPDARARGHTPPKPTRTTSTRTTISGADPTLTSGRRGWIGQPSSARPGWKARTFSSSGSRRRLLAWAGSSPTSRRGYGKTI
jgi:predicted metalloendopeptidase